VVLHLLVQNVTPFVVMGNSFMANRNVMMEIYFPMMDAVPHVKFSLNINAFKIMHNSTTVSIKVSIW
jgi:hypothetical protein